MRSNGRRKNENQNGDYCKFVTGFDADCIGRRDGKVIEAEAEVGGQSAPRNSNMTRNVASRIAARGIYSPRPGRGLQADDDRRSVGTHPTVSLTVVFEGRRREVCRNYGVKWFLQPQPAALSCARS